MWRYGTPGEVEKKMIKLNENAIEYINRTEFKDIILEVVKFTT